MNVHLITPIIWFALLITFQICRSNYNILAKVIPKSFSASHVFIFCSSSFNFMVYSTSRFLLPMRMTLHLDTLTNCLYRRFAVYPAQQVGELLTQRKSRHASGTVFDYDTRNNTLNNKAAQNIQCSIQSVSVKKKKKKKLKQQETNSHKNACLRGLFIFCGLPTREPSSIICYDKQDHLTQQKIS